MQTMQPFFTGASSGPNYCNFDFANGVSGASNYAKFIGYSSTNFGGTTQLFWTNIVPWGATGGTLMAEDSGGPIVTNAGPATGLYSVDFSGSTYAGNHYMACVNAAFTKINGSNQPVTVFIVATDVGHTGNGSVLLDANVGAGASREKYVLTSDNPGYFDAGAFQLTYQSANTANWYIYTIVYDGTASYSRTNGVRCIGYGNTGSNAQGFPVIGADAIDAPAIAAYLGKVWAVLFYSGRLNTNDMISVERALNCQGKLGYTIPGP